MSTMGHILRYVPILPIVSMSFFCNIAAVAATDDHSFAEPDQVSVRHLDLELEVDFQRRVLRGRASWEVTRSHPTAQLTLDTRDLKITNVFVNDIPTAASFELGNKRPHLGRSLTIELPVDDADNASPTTVHIDYETSPSAMALQWLRPQQTAGGQHPFLFSQSQAILARSWIPCQDSPGVRFTYTARSHCPLRPDGFDECDQPADEK